MQAVGVVAEYDPFHTGHARHLARTRELLGGRAAVAAVMSGNWVQRSGPAVADKWTRARIALLGGADLVLELPTVWAASTAESFARGAVSLLNASGVVDTLSFGSECGELGPLERLAGGLDSAALNAELRRLTNGGVPFARARQAAAEKLLGPELARLLAQPNNNLGVEYLRALNALCSPMKPMTVLREGAGHGGGPNGSPFVSASWLREELRAGRREAAEPYLVPGTSPLLSGGLPDPARIERAVLARLRMMSADDWSALPDAGAAEGLPFRLERAGRTCACLAAFFERAKTKRYTHSRLRRLVLWAFLGLKASDVPASPPYLRVLGFNGRGRELLREMKDAAALPVLTRPARARELGGEALRLFELEARCTDLYGLCLERVPAPGREWTAGPVILE